MSNEQRVLIKVLRKLKKTMKGVHERYIVVWAMMVSGIVLSGKARLSAMAAEIPSQALEKSTFRRFQRMVSNDNIDAQAHFMPFAEHVLSALSGNRLVFAMDGSQVGRSCMVLMVGVVYCNRLLPLTWLVYKGKKGHASAAQHVELLEQLLPMVPEDTEVVLLGDGEFDNVEMLAWLKEHTNWDFVVRTAKSTKIIWDGEEERIEGLAEEGYICCVKQTQVTGKRFGPVQALAWWGEDYDEPIYLLSSLQDVDEICKLYQKRALIETLFSDQKSRGFGIDKSHLKDPEKLDRLLTASCLAYLWMVWLGIEVIRTEQTHLIDHRSRRDKSVFRLGLDWLKYLLRYGQEFVVSFEIPEASGLALGVM